LEIFDAEYERSIKVQNSLSLIPSSPGAEIILWNRDVNKSHPRLPSSTGSYALPVQFQISDAGELLVLCELSVEDYIRGVLTLVMGEEYPLEALKSQAVASRTLALARLNLNHPQEPYDLCSDAHCQLFNGISDGHPTIEKAVSQTRGEVLFCGDELYETPYTILCGGYTEDRYVSNKKQTMVHSQGIWDGPVKPPSKTSLAKEEEIARWVTSSPPVYCNPVERKVLEAFDHKKALFRWEVSYPRKKLEEIIHRKSGENIGTLFDILPLKRGRSGRLTAVEILGSRKNIRIQRENNIRRILSDDSLHSSCFVVEKEMGENGIPFNFTFIGAGYGHGVGMCQAGATAMASEGKSHTEILRHYFKKGKVKKIYN
jgi:SpoIID/LytB domain protein